jgi:cytochrome c oxidase subunit 2
VEGRRQPFIGPLGSDPGRIIGSPGPDPGEFQPARREVMRVRSMQEGQRFAGSGSRRGLGFAGSVLRAAAAIALVVAGAPGCQVAPAATVEHGEFEFSNYCSQCHGAAGQGQESIGAPSIAGLPDWYVVEQLNKFRGAVRGTHFDDIEGMRMRPMALTLGTQTDVEAVAMYVASLPPAPVHHTLEGGNAEKGKTLFTTCTACHGADGAGNVQLGAPPLTLQPDWYVARQLGKFKAGIRGANPNDLRGAQMRPMAATLPDEQAVLDVVAYIGTLKQAAPQGAAH